MAERLRFTRGAFGLTQYENGDVALAGGVRTGRLGTPGTERLRYGVYDVRMIEAGLSHEQAQVGEAEINVVPETGGIEGVVNLKLAPRHRGLGIGRRVVEALAASSDAGLRVYDVKKAAAPFWRKLGCELSKAPGGRQVDGVFEAPEPVAAPGMRM